MNRYTEAARRVLAAVLVACVAATLLVLPASAAPVDCRLVSPQDGQVFAQGEPQRLVVNCGDSTGLPVPYTASIVIRNAVTNTVVATIETLPAPSGTDTTATPALQPGTYVWHLSADDPSVGQTFGVASTTPIVSATCASGPPPLIDGFVERVYVRARTHSPQADVAWVCVRADSTNLGQRGGGRLEIVTDDPDQPLTITQDTVPCGPPPTGVVPMPLPVEIGDPNNPTTSPAYTAVISDVRVADNQLKVCFDVIQGILGAFQSSIVVDGFELADLDVLRFVPDVDQQHVTDRPTWTGPSADCLSSGWRWLDADIMGSDTRFWVHDYLGPTKSFCVRMDDGTTGHGGKLVVDQGDPEAGIPAVTSDTTPPPLDDPDSPCRWQAFTIGPFTTRYDDDVNKPALCFRATTFAVDVLVTPGTADPPAVDWIADPGSPDPS